MVYKVKKIEAVRENTGAVPETMDRVNLVIPKRLKTEWKLACIKKDMSMTELIQKAVDDYINKSDE